MHARFVSLLAVAGLRLAAAAPAALAAGRTERVDIAPDGTVAGGEGPAISATGRFVTLPPPAPW